MLENGSSECSCRKTKCERYGKCKECLEYHNKSERLPLPYCKRQKSNIVQNIFGKKKNKN